MLFRSQRGRNRGRERGRGGGRVARAQGGRGPRQTGQVHAAIGEATLEDEAGERAQLFAAIDNPRAPQQYAVVQTIATLTKVRNLIFLLIVEAHIHFCLLNV